MRWKLPRTERVRRKALEEAFNTTVHFAAKSEDGNFPATAVLFNIGLYLLLAERDIQAVKIDALTHPDEWTRKLMARLILLTIYEWDADKVSGKTLRDALELVQAPDHLRAEAIDALRSLRIVQRKARSQFSDLRNKTIAHRDPNALLQYRAIRDLNTQEVMSIAVEFYEGVNGFMKILTKLVVECSTFRSLVRQWQP